MARRARLSASPVWIFIAAGIVIAALGVGYFLQTRVNDPYRTVTVLPVEDYLQNADSLRGNVYKVDAVISQQLGYSRVQGRLFSLDLTGGKSFHVLVPPRFEQLNIERGQRYLFKVKVEEKGIVRAEDVRKS